MHGCAGCNGGKQRISTNYGPLTWLENKLKWFKPRRKKLRHSLLKYIYPNPPCDMGEATVSRRGWFRNVFSDPIMRSASEAQNPQNPGKSWPLRPRSPILLQKTLMYVPKCSNPKDHWTLNGLAIFRTLPYPYTGSNPSIGGSLGKDHYWTRNTTLNPVLERVHCKQKRATLALNQLHLSVTMASSKLSIQISWAMTGELLDTIVVRADETVGKLKEKQSLISLPGSRYVLRIRDYIYNPYPSMYGIFTYIYYKKSTKCR